MGPAVAPTPRVYLCQLTALPRGTPPLPPSYRAPRPPPLDTAGHHLCRPCLGRASRVCTQPAVHWAPNGRQVRASVGWSGGRGGGSLQELGAGWRLLPLSLTGGIAVLWWPPLPHPHPTHPHPPPPHPTAPSTHLPLQVFGREKTISAVAVMHTQQCEQAAALLLALAAHGRDLHAVRCMAAAAAGGAAAAKPPVAAGAASCLPSGSGGPHCSGGGACDSIIHASDKWFFN